MINNLFELKAEELARLGRAVGKKPLLIIVHPYFPKVTNKGTLLRPVNRNFDRFIKSRARKDRVVFIFEGEREIAKTSKILSRKGITRSDEVILVPTISKWNPRPISGWKDFEKIIKKMGVKKVVVGGRQFSEITLNSATRNAQELALHVFRVAKEIGVEESFKESQRATTRKVFKRYQDIRKALRISGQKKAPFGGCAGRTTARLMASRKFRVRTTKQFT